MPHQAQEPPDHGAEAGLGFLEGKATPKYDKQEDIYADFFTTLDAAVKQFDTAAINTQT